MTHGRQRSLLPDFSGDKLCVGYNVHARCINTADSCWPRLAKSPIVAYSCPWHSFDPIQAAPIALTAQNGLCWQPATMILRTACVCAELRGVGPSSTSRQREPVVPTAHRAWATLGLFAGVVRLDPCRAAGRDCAAAGVPAPPPASFPPPSIPSRAAR